MKGTVPAHEEVRVDAAAEELADAGARVVGVLVQQGDQRRRVEGVESSVFQISRTLSYNVY